MGNEQVQQQDDPDLNAWGFGILNTEMGIVGILPMIAEQYNVSIATAGWLVSGFALVVAAADRRCRCFVPR